MKNKTLEMINEMGSIKEPFELFEPFNNLLENEYKCVRCGNVYEKGWSDEESLNEMKELWGDLPKEDRDVICNDCFNEIHPERNLDLARKYGYKK